MKNQKAIVTIAIGEMYVECWKKYCQPNWQAYAHKYGYDLICLEHPLDLSSRAKLRSPAWQKCLILSQGFASDYQTVVWIDSDIVINDKAPDVAIGVPANKVGAVDAYEFSEVFPKRVYKMWPDFVQSPTPQVYYRNYGLPDDVDRAINTGVMVLSPSYHRALWSWSTIITRRKAVGNGIWSSGHSLTSCSKVVTSIFWIRAST